MNWLALLEKKMAARKAIVKEYEIVGDRTITVALFFDDVIITMSSDELFTVRTKSNTILVSGTSEDVDDYLLIKKLES